VSNREYNKQYHKEFREFVNARNIPNDKIIEVYKFNRRMPRWCSPCEDCDNPYCKSPCSRVFWCQGNM